jgi:hypothetical protein
MDSIFQFDDYVQSYGYQKIRYILRLVDMYNSDVATVLDLDLDFVGKVLGSGVVQVQQDYEEINDKFYKFLILFNYLLTISGNNSEDLRALLNNRPPNESTIYDATLNKPPWYRYGLLNYLKTQRLSGLDDCIKWITEY